MIHKFFAAVSQRQRLASLNPNIAMEFGVALALEKPIILIGKSGAYMSLPSNMTNWMVGTYYPHLLSSEALPSKHAKAGKKAEFAEHTAIRATLQQHIIEVAIRASGKKLGRTRRDALRAVGTRSTGSAPLLRGTHK